MNQDYSKMRQMFDTIREMLGGDVSLNMVTTLLLIAENPGITAESLSQRCGYSYGAASKILDKLGPGRKYGEGFKLVEERQDMNDIRSKPQHLTKQGERFVKELHKAIS